MAYLRAKQAPELSQMVQPDNLFMWQAFHHLRSDRVMGGAIPFAAMQVYCDYAGIDCPVQRYRLVKFVTALDNVEREYNGRSTP